MPTGCVARRQRNDGSTSVDHKVDVAAVDPGIDLKMAATVARHDNRARTGARRGRRRRRMSLQRQRRRSSAELRDIARSQNRGGKRQTGENKDRAHEIGQLVGSISHAPANGLLMEPMLQATLPRDAQRPLNDFVHIRTIRSVVARVTASRDEAAARSRQPASPLPISAHLFAR